MILLLTITLIDGWIIAAAAVLTESAPLNFNFVTVSHLKRKVVAHFNARSHHVVILPSLVFLLKGTPKIVSLTILTVKL